MDYRHDVSLGKTILFEYTGSQKREKKTRTNLSLSIAPMLGVTTSECMVHPRLSPPEGDGGGEEVLELLGEDHLPTAGASGGDHLENEPRIIGQSDVEMIKVFFCLVISFMVIKLLLVSLMLR